jgi:predicted RNA-binding Zn ribbon-like protein
MDDGVAAFPLLGEPLAVDLLNTVIAAGGGRRDLLTSPAALLAWLGAQAGRLPPGSVAALSAGLGAGDAAAGRLLGRVRALRESLRPLFGAALAGAAPPAAAVGAVNAAAAAAPAAPHLEWDAPGAPRAGLSYPGGRPGDALLAAAAASGIALLGGADRGRLRRCDGPGCVLLFVATNPRRRWCSAAGCGNRVRVARHYRRRHGAAPRRRAPAGGRQGAPPAGMLRGLEDGSGAHLLTSRSGRSRPA